VYGHITLMNTKLLLKYFLIDIHLGITLLNYNARSRGSSVSIVSHYGLDDWAIGVQSLAGAKDFSSSLCVQTGSEAHPASCTMGTGGPLAG
jgi:hypothetical protein